MTSAEYIESEDPKKFLSKKTGRGKLSEDWYLKQAQPVVCCYKLIDMEFVWLGLQTKIENYMVNMYKKVI